MDIFLVPETQNGIGSLDSILNFASLFVKGTQQKNQDNRQADMLAQQKEIEQAKLETARLQAQQQAQRTVQPTPETKDYTMWWIGGTVVALAAGGAVFYFVTRKPT